MQHGRRAADPFGRGRRLSHRRPGRHLVTLNFSSAGSDAQSENITKGTLVGIRFMTSDFSADALLPGVNVIWINHVWTQSEFKKQVICYEALRAVLLSLLSLPLIIPPLSVATSFLYPAFRVLSVPLLSSFYHPPLGQMHTYLPPLCDRRRVQGGKVSLDYID